MLILKRKNNFVILHFIEVNKYGSIVGRKYRICNRNFIEESFPECDVVVLGNEMLKSNRKKNILSRPFIKDEKELKEIFENI